MRSESMAWLLSLAGFEVHLLNGGYKAYRRYIREELSSDVPYLVLSGGTGSGKTEILKSLAKNGCQVLDLEGIARHKGSAFGAIGQENQPTNEQFENDLYDQWKTLDLKKPVWVEDESRAIGRVSIPEHLFQRLRKSMVIVLDMPPELRIHRLVAEYAGFPKEELIAGIQRISKNLGGDNAKKAIQAIENDDFEKAIGIVLFYYDKTYRFGLETRDLEQVRYLKTDSPDTNVNTLKVLEFCKNENLI
jgi:tRNA 2-selenouridine synthase